MLDLTQLRDKIDNIDSQIVRLFEERMAVAEKVARFKIETGKPVFDPQREKEKLETLSSQAVSEFNSRGIYELYRQIMSISRKRQYQLIAEQQNTAPPLFSPVDSLKKEGVTVVFQGVEGAYSYAAMNTFFGKNIKIGKNVFINACCHFQDHGGVEIGDGCQIGHDVVFATLNHGFAPEERQFTYPAPIVLGKNVWVGAHATIVPGVTVGNHAIIGAGAVVTKDVPERAIVAGVPARLIRILGEENQQGKQE